MTRLIALLLTAASSAALAHPSLVAHEHPHAFSSLAGLDALLVAALAVAFALVVWKRIRS